MRAGNLVCVVVAVVVVGVAFFRECSLFMMEVEFLRVCLLWMGVVYSTWVKGFIVVIAELEVEDLELVVRLVVRLV